MIHDSYKNFPPVSWLTKTFDHLDLMIFSVATLLVSFCIKAVPKVLPLLYKSVTQLRLDLVSKSWKQVVSYLSTRILDLCTSALKVRGREYIFPPHIFCIFIARIAWTPSLFFVNIMKDKPCSATWEHKHVYFNLLAYQLKKRLRKKKLEESECWDVTSWKNEGFVGNKKGEDRDPWIKQLK